MISEEIVIYITSVLQPAAAQTFSRGSSSANSSKAKNTWSAPEELEHEL
jgi:hypothetical protein